MKELIKNYENFKVEIGRIIGYDDLDCPITPSLDTQWSLSEDGKYINLDRFKKGDMWEYDMLQISSLGNAQGLLFMGEEDGLHFIMAYPDDEMWDECEIFIFDAKNKVEWNDDEY